jgi:hypothetical protein
MKRSAKAGKAGAGHWQNMMVKGRRYSTRSGVGGSFGFSRPGVHNPWLFTLNPAGFTGFPRINPKSRGSIYSSINFRLYTFFSKGKNL